MSGPGGIISDLYSGAASASYSFADVSPRSPVSPDYTQDYGNKKASSQGRKIVLGCE